jgi:Tfp pilus assembly protein FimT
MNGYRGVTLVEVTVVLACASILLLMAAPGLGRLQDEWSLWGAANLLESGMQWARMHAIVTNSSVVLQVDQDGCGFHWSDPDTGQAYENSIRRFGTGVRITAAPGKPVRFYPRGNTVPAGTYVIRGRAGQYRVVVNPAGRIRLQRD